MPARVVLAGHNLDRDLLREIRALLEETLTATEARDGAGAGAAIEQLRARIQTLLERDNWTPETLSAAYARISRDPRSVTELRAVAREMVDAARRSNETIIFGLGHASVAEHAVFNLDVLGLSRLGAEALEHTRLASYTEKSQRYILLEEDFASPEEIAGTEAEAALRAVVAEQSRFYREAYEVLLERILAAEPPEAAAKGERRRREGLAKEDARYALSLATTVQLGLTANARTLEGMLARLRAHPLAEARALAEALHVAVGDLAPSIIKYSEPSSYERDAGSLVRGTAALVRGMAAPSPVPAAIASDPSPECFVELVDAPEDPDATLAGVLLFSAGSGSMAECRRLAATMEPERRRLLLLSHLARLGPHDAVLREYEHVAVTFELVVSASCFAQLKRHRMATLTPLPYDPSLGVTIPPAIREAGLEPRLRDLASRAEDCAAQIGAIAPAASAYALTNAHRRRVLVRMNARELYHLSRLREDAHAQWDIRRVAARMLHLARARMPLTLALAAGKDRFEEVRRGLFP